MTTKVNFKNGVIALAIGLVIASCGGRGGNQQSGSATSDTKTEAAKSSGVDLVINDFTKQIPKPDIAIKSAYSTGQNGEIYMVNFQDATIEQVRAYAAKVKEAGFTIGADEGDGGDYYTYNAKNAAGWEVSLILTSRGGASITIHQPQ
jgi:hypothetical protein